MIFQLSASKHLVPRASGLLPKSRGAEGGLLLLVSLLLLGLQQEGTATPREEALPINK